MTAGQVTDRRGHLKAMLAMAGLLLPASAVRALEVGMEEVEPQYGLIGQMVAKPGERAALAAALTEGTGHMPGNFLYLVGEDAANPDALWIVELWTDKAAHAASLGLPGVQAAIAKGRPLIAGFGTRAEFKPAARTRA
jgi:quinol monooxygenase YgiN